MNEIRKKQRKLYKIMKVVTIVGAIYLFVYIGIQPYVADASQLAARICGYISDAAVIAVLVLVFMYYSKYGKADNFLKSAENEINDNGYYFTARAENTAADFIEAVSDDLSSCGYSVSKKVALEDFEADVKAVKSKEFFYAVNIDNVDSNDVVAYIDCVINDIVVKNLKRKGNAVILFVTDKADESAIALSKMITPVGKKEQLKVAVAIAEPKSKNVYFLGNVQTKCQQIIVNFVMNCDIPLKDEFIHKDKLPFQYALAEKMKDFTLEDYKAGNFYLH
ncbi:MAG: hypothetical protein NC213_02450 [Acetobacter sp.]|nr:hypothetical protein [Bacteroides sp.]MCM1340580.1 hypothetical protein [Acetobacter sp.]MCM1433320.1 hypothetical protein [Clostridiales bacterium]